MDETLNIKDHIAIILNMKREDPDECLFDLIMEYYEENQSFSIDEFLKEIRRNSAFKKYLKSDLSKFNYGKYGEELIETFKLTDELF